VVAYKHVERGLLHLQRRFYTEVRESSIEITGRLHTVPSVYRANLSVIRQLNHNTGRQFPEVLGKFEQ
jgi:hypothetical protein